MRKLDGLKFLRRHFPDICVDCVFIGKNELPDRYELERGQPNFLRVRSGRSFGSELNLPRRTCQAVEEVQAFITECRAQDAELEFVAHRVDSSYFAPIFVGTLALFNQPFPTMKMYVQSSSSALVEQMDKGVRARDWPVVAIYTFPYFARTPEIQLLDPSFSPQCVSRAILRLWEIGCQIDEIQEAQGATLETVTLFNIYPSERIIVDDHRSVRSFVGGMYLRGGAQP